MAKKIDQHPLIIDEMMKEVDGFVNVN